MKGKAPGRRNRKERRHRSQKSQACRSRNSRAGEGRQGPTRRTRSMDLKVMARNSYSASVINLYFLRLIQCYRIKYKSNQKL